jgi:FtsZ-interacting cell division protein YlmF
MSILGKIREFVGDSEEMGDYSSEVVLMEINTYQEVGIVTNYLIDEKTIIINTKGLPGDEVCQVTSFLEGALFVIGCEMKQLEEKTFLCVPNTVAIVDKDKEVTKEEESAILLDEALETKKRNKSKKVVEEVKKEVANSEEA